MRVWYRVDGNDFGDELELLRQPIDEVGELTLEVVAGECAELFYANHDGWEAEWPIELDVLSGAGGRVLGRFSVAMEVEPQFYANRIPDATEAQRD